MAKLGIFPESGLFHLESRNVQKSRLLPRQFTWKLPLHPPEDHPGVAPEASEHEEVDHRVEGRGGLSKQRGRHSVAVGDFLGKGNHFLVTSPWSLREFGISAFVTY